MDGTVPSSVYAAVFEAIDASVAMQRCLPQAQASVQRALVQLRRTKSDADAVQELERMSVHLHQLATASMSTKDEMRNVAVEQLRRAASSWMARLPMQ